MSIAVLTYICSLAVWFQLLMLYSSGSLGHSFVLQLSVLCLGPTQSAPLDCGAGFSQVRIRVREPTPQVLEQLLQDDH